MKSYEELKSFCDKEIEKFPEYQKRYKKEMAIAKRFYDEKINLYDELMSKKDKVDDRYVIPFLLKITSNVDLTKNPEYIKIKEGSSGGKVYATLIGNNK